MSLQSVIRDIQRLHSALPIRQFTSALDAIETPMMRQLRAMDQSSKLVTNGFDTPEVRTLLAMERDSIISHQTIGMTSTVAQILEMYQRFERMVPPFVDDALRSAKSFQQLIGHVQSGLESAVQVGQQLNSITDHASGLLSSVDWPTVLERLEGLSLDDEVELEREIHSTVDEVCREAVEDGGDLVTIIQRLRSPTDEPRIERRDAIVDGVKSVAQNVVGTVIGGLILKTLIDIKGEPADKPQSQDRQRRARKTEKRHSVKGERKRNKQNSAGSVKTRCSTPSND